MKNNIRIARELMRIARTIVAEDKNNVKEFLDEVKSSVSSIQGVDGVEMEIEEKEKKFVATLFVEWEDIFSNLNLKIHIGKESEKAMVWLLKEKGGVLEKGNAIRPKNPAMVKPESFSEAIETAVKYVKSYINPEDDISEMKTYEVTEEDRKLISDYINNLSGIINKEECVKEISFSPSTDIKVEKRKSKWYCDYVVATMKIDFDKDIHGTAAIYFPTLEKETYGGPDKIVFKMNNGTETTFNDITTKTTNLSPSFLESIPKFYENAISNNEH